MEWFDRLILRYIWDLSGLAIPKLALHNNGVKILKNNKAGNTSSYFIMGSRCFQLIELCSLFITNAFNRISPSHNDVSHIMIWKYPIIGVFLNKLTQITCWYILPCDESHDDLYRIGPNHPRRKSLWLRTFFSCFRNFDTMSAGWTKTDKSLEEQVINLLWSILLFLLSCLIVI